MNENNNYHIQEEESIDIKKYLFMVLHHWWWFAVALFIALGVAYLINRYSQEQYTASCSLIVGEEESGAGSVDQILDEMTRYRKKRRKAIVENEISILKSYRMARMALEELDFHIAYTSVGRRNIAETRLYKTSPFIVMPDTSKSNPPATFYVTIKSLNEYELSLNDEVNRLFQFGKKIEYGNYGFTITLRDPYNFKYIPEQSNKYYFTFQDINSLAKQYRNALLVEVNDEKGSILTLNMEGFVPEKISKYLNKLSEVYIRSNLMEKNITSMNTIEFIDNQLRGIVDSLENAGLRLQNFRSHNKVIDLSKEGDYLFTQMQELQNEKAKLKINERYYRYLLEYIEEKDDYSDIVAPSVVGINDRLLDQLVNQLNTLNLERKNLGMSVHENSPQFSLINNKILNTKQALHENLTSLISANEIAQKNLETRIEEIEFDVQKLPSTERQLINIQREFAINDQIYTFLLEKRAEAGITRASNTSDHSILDIARPENATTIKPNKKMNYMIAFALGIMLPFMILILMDMLQNRIMDRKDIESKTKVPVMGSIGHSQGVTELPVIENPKSSLAESFRGLRTNLNYQLNDKDKKIVMVTSTISGEGKTFCAVNLATILAMSGKKVLLAGFDLRKPKIHKIFNLDNKSGISTYLINKTSWEELIVESNIEHLFIAPSGPVPPNPAELMESNYMKEFIEKAKEQFDYIIVDTPPLAVVTDGLLLRQYAHATLFVVRQKYSYKSVLEMINEFYSRKELPNLGILINDVTVSSYYGYNYSYNYKYGYEISGYYNEESPKKNLIHNWIKKK